MTNPTSNFGWQMPTATDLVTDLPADFEVFGQAVDTSMADLKGGTTGQILSKATNADMDFVWTSPNPGDITGVTAGTGISGGGTSGDVTITNSMATTIDAKGDLIVGTADNAFNRVAVGTNGQVLTADSTAAAGLAWATPSAPSNTFYAGKNKIINANFGIWQRGTSISLTNNTTAYTTDRWYVYTSFSAGSSTLSQQTFTPGAAPVSGYEGTNFARFTAGSTATYFEFGQRIEDVRVLAGQTATISFWAKASANTTVSSTLLQNFGSGGSTQVSVTGASHSLTTSWQRFNVSVSVPSISGKTIGTSSYLALTLAANSLTGSQTIDVWGTQLEAGSSVTDFVTASGNSPQAELAMCQRYFANVVPSTADYGTVISMFQATSGSTAKGGIRFPVPMRTSASIILASATNFTLANASYTPIGGSSFTYAVGNTVDCRIDMSVASGLTAGNATALSGNTANLLIQASAEL